MSATNRSAERVAADFYPTPAWCVRRLLDRVELPGRSWLEPCAGEGAIIRAVNSLRIGTEWTAIDLRRECGDALREVVGSPWRVLAGANFLTEVALSQFDTVITNPPFSLAMEFIEASLPLASYVAMLLRVNFLGSAKRAAFFRSEMPDVYVLPNRPSFTGHGTDATEYCWAVWTPERGRKHGRVEVLDETPAMERRS